MLDVRGDGRRQLGARRKRLERVRVDRRGTARLLHQVEHRRFLQECDQMSGIDRQGAIQRAQLVGTSAERSQCRGEGQPQRQVARRHGDCTLQQLTGGMRIARGQVTARPLVKHQRMFRGERLGLLQQPERLGFAPLAQQPVDRTHQGGHFLLVDTLGLRSWRAHAESIAP